ncbi:MAG: acylphosphatase [Candidatus Eremiobacteraeota bacterium]|nr:acylphosphatase [Candidatus Eremiobacteraeota bacterium]MBV8222214.1 acylphosphatase [Candidatus Eremiobacteraeota bacterium]MBV8280447.1 acylphosphatase [Candidatus Eremiobacteraeota bacterium]
MPRLHLRIRGHVQGVFFRVSAVEQALDLRLTGWVRNRNDGSIEIVAEGPEDSLAALRAWCEHGPPGADVQGIEESEDAPTGKFEDFTVRSNV